MRFGPFLGVLLAAASLSAAPTQITLLHVNDTHSHLDAWGPKAPGTLTGTIGGLPRAASLVLAEKAGDPETLFVHAGDLFNGDPLFNEYLGVPELLLLQSLGLDAMAVGNHEFQFGPDFLAAVLGAAWPAADGFPLLSSNADLSAVPVLANWVKSTSTRQVHGIEVGFFGLTTPYDAIEQPSPVVLASGDDLFFSAAQAVTALRAQGAQVIVCLAHLGMPLSRAIAAQVPGIDVIVNGHDHVMLRQPELAPRPGGGKTIIVSAGDFYRGVGRLRLEVDGGRVAVASYDMLDVGADVPAVPELQAMIDWLKLGVVQRFGDLYGEGIGFAEKAVPSSSDPRHSKRDTPAGNLFTDAYRAVTGTQIAVEASGFLETGLPEGPIVGADVFRTNAYGLPAFDPSGRLYVQPFHLATFRISGADIVKGLELGLTEAGGDMFLQVSGMRFEYDSSQPDGQKVLLGTVHVGGHKLALDRLYTTTANEGVLFFLPQLGIPVQDVVVREETVFGTVRDFVEALGIVEPKEQNRIRDVAR